jgi:hypothetical protein
MNEGVFAVHRGVFKHELFADEPYTEREAWIWLIGNAAWKQTRARVKGAFIPLERGQLAYSLRFLAEHWRWSKNKVSRFFDLLKNEGMIGTRPGRSATVITICKYDDYQLTPGYIGTQNSTETGHGRDTTGTKKNKDNKDNKRTLSPAARDDDEFEKFWTAYPRRASASPKKPARAKFNAAVRRGVPSEKIISGARAYAAEQDRIGKTGTQYVKTPEVWLNQEGWTAFDDEKKQGPPQGMDAIARRDWIRAQMEVENAEENAKAASGDGKVLDGGDRFRPQGEPGCAKPRVVQRGEGHAEPSGDMGKVLYGQTWFSTGGAGDVEGT